MQIPKGSYPFPSVNIPEKKKDEQWYKEFVHAISARCLNSDFARNYTAVDSCYQFYNGTQGGDQFLYMQQAEDGSSLPAPWMNLNKIRPKINLLLGELMTNGYDFRVTAINKEAKARKLAQKEALRVDIRLKPHLQEIEEETGYDTQIPDVPDNEDELDEFFEKNHKEITEVIVYHALRFLDKKMPWNTVRVQLFRDLLVAGKCFVKNELHNGIPRARRVDPRNFVYDTNSEDELLRDSTFFGEVRQMNVADAAEKYDVTPEQLEESAKQYFDYLKGAPNRNNTWDQYWGSDLGSLKWFSHDVNGLRVLVLEACWVDYKKRKYKESQDSSGGYHLKEVSDNSKDKEEILTNKKKVWRKGTLLGGVHLVDYGLLENQARDVDSLRDVYPPYCGITPHAISGHTVSVVEQLKSLQNLKDVLTYNILLQIAKAGSKGFVYDVSQSPDGWQPEEVIKYLKTTGIAFINSRQGGVPAQFNQFNPIDLSLTEAVAKYLEMSRWVDMEMDAISGINDARQGIVQGSSQAVGVTSSAITQSSLTTATYFRMFDQFTGEVFNQLAKLVKVSWAGKEKYAPIIGDAGINFLQESIDLDLNDYAVFVEATPKILQDINAFQQLVLAAIQSGDLSFDEAMELLLERDVVSGIQRYKKLKRKKEAAKAEMEQQYALQQQQAKAQSQMQAQAQMAQFNEQTSQAATKRAMAQEKLRAQADIQKELVKQRGNLQMKALETEKAE